MELLFLALIITVVLALSPVRSEPARMLRTPPAVCRHVDPNEIRYACPVTSVSGTVDGSAYDREGCALAAHQCSSYTIEDDNIEAVTLEGARMSATMRDKLLWLRVDPE